MGEEISFPLQQFPFFHLLLCLLFAPTHTYLAFSSPFPKHPISHCVSLVAFASKLSPLNIFLRYCWLLGKMSAGFYLFVLAHYLLRGLNTFLKFFIFLVIIFYITLVLDHCYFLICMGRPYISLVYAKLTQTGVLIV